MHSSNFIQIKSGKGNSNFLQPQSSKGVPLATPLPPPQTGIRVSPRSEFHFTNAHSKIPSLQPHFPQLTDSTTSSPSSILGRYVGERKRKTLILGFVLFSFQTLSYFGGNAEQDLC